MTKREKNKIQRLEVVSKLFKKGYTYRQIRIQVMDKLGLKTYSLQTVKRDIDTLLAEWQQERIESLDQALQLELKRIDDSMTELWKRWHKKRNVNIITEIRHQQIERRKLLGLYAPEKRDISGVFSQSVTISTDQLTEEEKRHLLNIARKIDPID